MELGSDLPVTLVIKAPNQRIEDQTVDCMLGWTVKKLKEHLRTVYPNKPNEKHQKLIYSGKLLADHLTLKEVLRQFDDDNTNLHTVHLVCSSPYNTLQNYTSEKESHTKSQANMSTSSTYQPSNTQPVGDSSNLRYRGSSFQNVNQSTQQPPFGNPVNTNMFGAYNLGGQFPQMPQFPAGFPPEAAAAMYGAMPQGAGMAYTPEQLMWMQQAYAQYMAQYMQYYQQAGYQMQNNTGFVNEQNIENQNAPNNNNQQNVQDGADLDDGDEEFGQRDWLDYLYTFSRLMVLLGIVYFYSNLTRFIMVAVFFIVVYFYQMGWLLFTPRRRNIQQNQQENQQQQQQQFVDEQNQQHAETDQNENTDSQNTETTDSPPVVVQPQGPGALKIAWTFVLTFFTSLFPAPPPPVNVN